MSVTVVMPTYKHVPYISTAFSGILEQTYRNVDVIVISYSRDTETNEWLSINLPSDWTWLMSNVLYAIHQLNMGFEKVETDYVVFASTDDMFLPDKIRTDVENITIREHRAWVSYGPFYHGNSDLSVIDRFDPPKITKYEDLLQRDVIPDCSLISKEAFDEFGLLDEALGESGGPIWDFWLKILEKDPKLFAYNPYTGWIYRQGNQQTSARRPPVDAAIRKWMLERSLRRSGRVK